MALINTIPVLLILALASCRADDLEWYRTALSQQVAPPYVSAYRTLQKQIIDPLLAANASVLRQNATAVTALANGLNCGARALLENLTNSLNASEELSKTVDKKLADQVAAVSAKEGEVKTVSDRLTVLATQLNDAQNKVNQATTDVANKNAELNSANGAVAEEQRKVDKARNCIGRRKKRWLIGGWLGSTICSVVNYGGIDNAKAGRKRAEDARDLAQRYLDQYNGELTSYRNQQAAFQTQQSQATSEKQTLNAALEQLRAQQAVLSNITTQLHQVIKHIQTFVTPSSVLYFEIKQVMDFALLINPLNAILAEMRNTGVAAQVTAGASEVTATTVSAVAANLEAIKLLLPNVPLNVAGSSTC